MTHSRRNRSLRLMLCALLALALSAGAALSEPAVAGTLEVYGFQAGKADAFLIMTAGGVVLIDAGEKGFGKEILEYLEERGISAIDYLIITHFDKDHVGGAAKVINGMPVRHVLQSDCPKESDPYDKYLKAMRKADIEPVTVRKALSFTLDGVRYVVDPPRLERYEKHDSNNSSLIVSVYHGGNALLFTGDAQTERLTEFLDAGCGRYDFLKVPHHGEKEPLMEALAERTAPAYAVITSSEDKMEAASTVEALEAVGAEVLLTRVAPVVVTSDGMTLTARYAE